jgi:hypothetical protein
VTQRSSSIVLQSGIAVFVLAALADLVYHLLPRALGEFQPLVGPNAVNAHMLLVAAMAIVLLGVIEHGVRRGAGRGHHIAPRTTN